MRSLSTQLPADPDTHLLISHRYTPEILAPGLSGGGTGEAYPNSNSIDAIHTRACSILYAIIPQIPGYIFVLNLNHSCKKQNSSGQLSSERERSRAVGVGVVHGPLVP